MNILAHKNKAYRSSHHFSFVQKNGNTSEIETVSLFIVKNKKNIF